MPDNIKLIKRLESMDRPSLATIPPNLRPNLREVPSLLTWVFCFAQYIAVLSESHPHLVRSRLAYMCLTVHEGRKNGGRGWAEYDALFQLHAAAAKLDEDEANTDWARLEPSLHTSCLIGARDGEGVLCTLCSGSDHPVSSYWQSPSNNLHLHHTSPPPPELEPAQLHPTSPSASSGTKGTAGGRIVAIATPAPPAQTSTELWTAHTRRRTLFIRGALAGAANRKRQP